MCAFCSRVPIRPDHISGRKVYHDVMGLKGFDVRERSAGGDRTGAQRYSVHQDGQASY
jgi:hypothetical protein